LKHFFNGDFLRVEGDHSHTIIKQHRKCNCVHIEI